MGTTSRQIGWSNESNLLFSILREVRALQGQAYNMSTTTTSSTSSTTTTTTTVNSNLTLKIDNSPNFDIPAIDGLGTGAFTISWSAKMTADDNHPRAWSIGSWPSAAHAVSIENGQFYYWINGSIFLSTDISSYNYLGNWTCFMILRTSNGKIKIYINGSDTGAQAPNINAIPSNGLPLYIGSEGNDSIYNGLMNNFIWLNYELPGCPSSPWITDSGTLLSIFQGNDLSQLITDNSGNSYTITNGSGIFNAGNPFGSGGSIQFGTI